MRDQAAAARFHREMRLTARIEHPNTIRVYDFGETEGQLFLTMELLRGHTLAAVLAQSRRLELPRIVRIASQVCRALQAAHSEGVVHRDLKPDNGGLTVTFQPRQNTGTLASPPAACQDRVHVRRAWADRVRGRTAGT